MVKGYEKSGSYDGLERTTSKIGFLHKGAIFTNAIRLISWCKNFYHTMLGYIQSIHSTWGLKADHHLHA